MNVGQYLLMVTELDSSENHEKGLRPRTQILTKTFFYRLAMKVLGFFFAKLDLIHNFSFETNE